MRADDEQKKVEDGPIKVIDPTMVPNEPPPMTEGFEWVTMDLTDDKEVDYLQGSGSIVHC